MNYGLISIPVLSAFTGWIVVKVMLKLVFRPLEPRKIMGFTWQGIIPRHKQQIAERIGKIAATEFANFPGIEQKISDPANMEKIKPVIESHVDDFLRNKLKEQMPMISMFIGDKTINTLKVVFMQEVEALFPHVMKEFSGNLKNDLDIEQMVVSKISRISPGQIEAIIHDNLGKQFQLAAAFGALIGLLIGLIQLGIIAVTG